MKVIATAEFDDANTMVDAINSLLNQATVGCVVVESDNGFFIEGKAVLIEDGAGETIKFMGKNESIDEDKEDEEEISETIEEE